MKDNQVRNLVDVPPDGRSVGSKWIFKKKIDIDAYSYKNSYSIAVFYDYEIWKWMSKPLNVYLSKDDYMVQPELFIDPIYLKERFKMYNSKHENIPMQEIPNLSKSQGVSTPEEEPVEIVNREVKRLKRSRIPLVKVRWNSKRGPEFT
nr:putative reverse transcriptase domain-containing protein [Tanacetum cinerariifolium]